MSDHPYLPFISHVLTPQRLAHSLGVMQVMGELAEIYALDPATARTTGLLHDAAKDLTPTKQQRLIEEGQIRIADPSETNYVLYLHAPVGAYFVQKELGLRDELILAAIATHCYYGDSPLFHHPLCWCLRFADVIEPTRAWHQEALMREKVGKLEKLIYDGRLAEAVIYQTGMLMRWFRHKGFPVHPNMRAANQRFAVLVREV